jgi:hypothetical protein
MNSQHSGARTQPTHAIPVNDLKTSGSAYMPSKDGSASALNGRRGRTRTCDPLLRRQMLYPPELRARLLNMGIGPNYLLSVAVSTAVPRGTFLTVSHGEHLASIA